jgi:hypothetical protein
MREKFCRSNTKQRLSFKTDPWAHACTEAVRDCD